ncbi:MAG TPA: cytochrome b/b6 domain-containing protein [Opitutaceae bacterium]|nr:cytochrome b/b6 domain-containing protein [Opitutaceae bacterium]
MSALRGAAPSPAPPNASAACLECHSDTKLTMKKAGRLVSLFADPAVLAGSAHRSLDCTDCHEGFDAESLPHQRPLTAVDCAGCHDDAGRKHAFHPRLARSPLPAGPDTACTGCHGTHAVTRVKSVDFAFAAKLEVDACGQCHEATRDHFRASAHGRALAQAAPDAPDCLTCHRQALASPVPGRSRLDLKLAQVALCESCHLKKPTVAGKTLLGTPFVASFDRSVHGAALARGQDAAANCVDCHGSHQMNLAMVAGSRISKPLIPETCAKCHGKIAAEFESSVHASAFHRGNLDSPVCTTCHGEHDIRLHTDPRSPVYSKNVAQQVCASCHASVRLTRKYGLEGDVFQTFSDSFHGLAVRGGAVVVVNCASCHGAHAIKSPLDPSASVNPRNLATTCGQCHPGANTRFTIGRVHSSVEQRTASPILYWIANLYVLLIVLVVGGMGLHNLLDFLKKIRREVAVQKGLIQEQPVPHRLYLRMTVNQRLQHAGLAISFALLVLTGFMLRYPEAWWVVAIRHVSDQAFLLRSLIHRLAGLALIAAGLWHSGYLALTAEGRQLFRDLLPRKRDLTDPWAVMRYNLGFAKAKPLFGRFSYIEKAEYWALIWGTVLMGVTGGILWFENASMGLFTKLGFDISRTIHFYEAVLATLAIIAWHFYFVIFNPDVYPMNLAWLTGRISEREMLEDHPLELQRLKQDGGDAGPSLPPARKTDPSDDPPPS